MVKRISKHIAVLVAGALTAACQGNVVPSDERADGPFAADPADGSDSSSGY